MNNPVAKNCNKFHRAVTYADKKKGWVPDLDEELEEYFEDLVNHAQEIAIEEYADRKDKARIC